MLNHSDNKILFRLHIMFLHWRSLYHPHDFEHASLDDLAPDLETNGLTIEWKVDGADCLVDQAIDLKLNIPLIERYIVWFGLHHVIRQHLQIWVSWKVLDSEAGELGSSFKIL